MDTSEHTMATLFEQLGLPSDDQSIAAFISAHRPLAEKVTLAEATFWSASQKAFLEESIADDADWAEVVDQLDAALRN